MQIYNFYLIAKSYFAFSHNDLKLDNIMIDKTTNQLYIIDFGYSRIRLNIDNKCFNLYSRNIFDEQSTGELYDIRTITYESFVNNITNFKYTSDEDFEKLYYSLFTNIPNRISNEHNKNIYLKISNFILQYIKSIYKLPLKIVPQSHPKYTSFGKFIKDNPIISNLITHMPLYKYSLFNLHDLLHIIIPKFITDNNCNVQLEPKPFIMKNDKISFYKYILTLSENTKLNELYLEHKRKINKAISNDNSKTLKSPANKGTLSRKTSNNLTTGAAAASSTPVNIQTAGYIAKKYKPKTRKLHKILNKTIKH